MSYLEELFGLSGQTAVVIGGTGELCGAMAIGLAKAGAEVVIVGRNQEKAYEKLAEMEEAGGGGYFIPCDVGDSDALRGLLDQVLEKSGKVDILVNGAGINSPTPFFDIPEDVAYLNCAYISPLLNSVRDVGIASSGRKSHPWEILPRDFFSDAEQSRALFAELIGATADDIALVPAASYGTATAARNLQVGPGERILVLHDQFPSNVYPWRELAKERGGTIITLPHPEDDDWTRAILEVLDERVAIAALPHVHWTDGALIDLERVASRCREVGAALVIDGTQSVGALPFDVNAIQPDFLVSASYKWLLGPYGSGYLYVAPKWQNGVPIEHNWIDREGSEDFSNLVEYRDSYQPGARRFDVGRDADGS